LAAAFCFGLIGGLVRFIGRAGGLGFGARFGLKPVVAH